MSSLPSRELDFPADLWQSFADGRPSVRCSAGYLIYLQDTQATCFYYLKSGRVKSYIQSPDGAQRVLRIYGQGSLFGEAAFFDELPRVSSAVALSPCELVPIDREMVRVLSAQVDDMAFRPARERIARHLLTLSPTPDGTLACTQEEIASSVSASRVTVARTLSEFARLGWLKTGYGGMKLLNESALLRLCQPDDR